MPDTILPDTTLSFFDLLIEKDEQARHWNYRSPRYNNFCICYFYKSIYQNTETRQGIWNWN